jgi:subtilisin family serine protease
MLRKVLAFVLLLASTSALPMSPSVAADTSNLHNLSSAPACQVALQAKWLPFGAPFPCFVSGTQLSVETPRNVKPQTNLIVKVNSDVHNAAWSSTFVIPTYSLGLNKVSFGTTDGSGNFQPLGQPLQFIIYSSPRVALFALALPETKPYVVEFRAGADAAALTSNLGLSKSSYLASSITSKAGSASGSAVYVMDLSAGQLSVVQANPEVESVTEQQILYGMANQTSPPSWGLDRIDQSALPLNSNYEYRRTGTGVNVYVVDSGLNATHTEFTGRIGLGAYVTSLGSTDDCNGHGTHVSGTIAGTNYGVAKQATIIPVRILDCSGSGTLADLVDAVNWIIADHQNTQPAVVNMSIGGSYSSSVNNAIQDLIDDGVVVVVAAGNESDDACLYSPSSATNAITVGSSTITDQDASYSNIGTCVDIFAPGSGITSAWIGSNSATAVLNGTSMASPHVAGAAALVLEADYAGYANKANANALVRTSLLNHATPDVLTSSIGGSWWATTSNYLLNTSSIIGPALTPTFSTATSTSDGFTLQISNYDSAYTWTGTHSSTGTVSINGTGLITVTGLAPGVASTVTINTARTGYASGSATSTQISSLAGPALIPIFSTDTATVDGFELQISNYDPAYTWSGSNSETGTVTISSSGLVSVTGLAPSVASTVTITTSRSGYSSGSATSNAITSLTGPALTPTFASATRTADGFTLQITNYSASYTWSATNSETGTVTISVSGLIRVTGLAPGLASTVTVTTSRSGYSSGSATSASVSSLSAALIPIFAIAAPTADGFNVQISNYDAAYTWTATSSETATATINVSGLISVTGIAPGVLSTLTVTSSRTGYASGSSTTPSVRSLFAALTPTFATATPTSNGFTVQINNYSASYTWVGTNSAAGTLAISNSGLVTVAGLGAGVTSTITITSSRSGYVNGVATSVSVTSLAPVYTPPPYIPPPPDAPALNPIFSTAIPTANGFTLQISNYDSAFTWLGTNSLTGTVSISASGLVTVTGIAPAIPSTVTINTTRSGYVSGSTTSNAVASLPGVALLPTFSSNASTADGFTLQIANYNSAYIWSGTNSAGGNVQISSSGLITVTGLAPGVISSVTVNTSRTGYNSGSAASDPIASITGTALIPTFGGSNSTADGFTLQISNYDGAYSWSVTNSQNGTAVVSPTGLITVAGLSPGVSSTVTVATSRSGYAAGSATSDVSSSNLAPALIPTFINARPTLNGFTLQISNYDPSFTWVATNSSNGSVAIDGTGLITVSGLSSGNSSTVTVSTSRTGYLTGNATSVSISAKVVAKAIPKKSSLPGTLTAKSTIEVGKRLKGSTTISLNFAAKYAGKSATLELGIVKNGKVNYSTLGSVKLSSAGDATFSTKLILPKGSTVRVKVGLVVLQGVVVG